MFSLVDYCSYNKHTFVLSGNGRVGFEMDYVYKPLSQAGQMLQGLCFHWRTCAQDGIGALGLPPPLQTLRKSENTLQRTSRRRGASILGL